MAKSDSQLGAEIGKALQVIVGAAAAVLVGIFAKKKNDERKKNRS